MDSLKKRLFFSAILIAITLSAIFLAPRWFFFLVMEILGLIALSEFLNLSERKGIATHRPLALFFGALLPFSIYFFSEAMILVLTCLCLFLFNFQRRLRNQALVSTSVVIFGIVYVIWFFFHLTKLRYLPQGSLWVFYTVLLVKGGDAAAYFVGKRMGKTKLIEHISPQKSIEGAFGGLLATLSLSVMSKLYLTTVPFVHLIILGVVVGILAQLGDLAESLLKRDAGVKDSGHVPGLGGILDVLDSILLTAPFVYYYAMSFSLI